MNLAQLKTKEVSEMNETELREAVSMLLEEVKKIDTIRDEIKGLWSTETISVHRLHQILKTYD